MTSSAAPLQTTGGKSRSSNDGTGFAHLLQRHAGRTGTAGEAAGTAPPSVDRALARAGAELEPGLRRDMERRFGHDFSRVRVHSDSAAEQSALEVSAKAYTVGNDIVFGAGQLAPGTNEGRRLIAHELTHVVQQTGGGISRRHRSNAALAAIPPGSASLAMSVAPRVMRTADQCVEKCEKYFDECLKHGKSAPECLGARSACLHGCPPSKKACVVKEQIPIITKPVVVFDDGVFMQTGVDIEWKTDSNCDCACGEYRQFVKGHIFKNGKRFDIDLCDGAKLEESTWHEDGDQQAKNFCMGHRDRKENKNDIFDRPDRASGCHYHGKDEPSVPGKAGDAIDVDLKFKGQTFDKCSDTFGAIHEWSFTYKGPLGGL